jgi:hypothetical protein
MAGYDTFEQRVYYRVSVSKNICAVLIFKGFETA